MSIRDRYLNPPRVAHRVEVKGFGEAYLRSLTVGEFDRITNSVSDTESVKLTVALSLCDEQGRRVFNDAEADLAVSGLTMEAALDICEHFKRINGVAGEAIEAEKKDSAPTP